LSNGPSVSSPVTTACLERLGPGPEPSMKHFVSCVLRLVSFTLVGACGKSHETPPPQSPAPAQPGGQLYGPQYGQAAYGQGGGPASVSPPYGQQPGYGQSVTQQAPGQMAPLGAVLADPMALENILSGALAGGAAMLGGLTGGEQGPLEQGIKMQAQAQARGATPEGQLMTARLAGDAHAEGSLTLQPGSCYTVIGFGGPGVFDYQLNLMTAPPVPPQILAQSPTGSVTPVVGANDQCVRSPYPLPLLVKLDMHLLRGQGMVGAQVYKK
jgi:hypothetical protein